MLANRTSANLTDFNYWYLSFVHIYTTYVINEHVSREREEFLIKLKFIFYTWVYVYITL